jgi:regulatory protein
MNKSNRQINIKEALNRLMQLCSRQEKCTYDIREKLKLWNIPEEEAEKIVLQLKSEKFLDDDRYTRFFVKDKFALNKWGRQKIRYMLLAKRVDKTIIDEALEQIPEDDYIETLAKELEKKRKQLSESNRFQLRARLFNFATQRGFEADIVYNVIDRILT